MDVAPAEDLPARAISSAYEDFETEFDHRRHRRQRGRKGADGPRRPPRCPPPPPPRKWGWLSWVGGDRPPPPRKGRHPCPPPGPHHPPPHHPPPHQRPHHPISVTNLTLPTLLADHSLAVNVTVFGEHTRLFVNGAPIHFADGPARNGALHVVDRLLHPFKHHPPPPPQVEGADVVPMIWEEVDVWADWEEWLPQWATE